MIRVRRVRRVRRVGRVALVRRVRRVSGWTLTKTTKNLSAAEGSQRDMVKKGQMH